MPCCVNTVLMEYEDVRRVGGAWGDKNFPGFDMESDFEACDLAREWLRNDGLGEGPEVSRTAQLIWLCEAINWAAKVVDPEYYVLKPHVINAVAKLRDVSCGWARDEGGNAVFYLFHPEAGVASFHDPDGEINADGSWDFPWSQVTRQEYGLDVWAGDVELANDLAKRTQPGMVEDSGMDPEFLDWLYGKAV